VQFNSFIYHRILSGHQRISKLPFNQGPVAVRHLIKKDEPIKEMLDNVVSGLKMKVLEHYYGRCPCSAFVMWPVRYIPTCNNVSL